MIPDNESNFVYLSDLIQQKAPNTFVKLEKCFKQFHIGYDLLPKTKDLWVIDFMPIQIHRDHFLQFTYDPDYLKSKKESLTRTDPKIVLKFK
jgi:agmatine deiminase